MNFSNTTLPVTPPNPQNKRRRFTPYSAPLPLRPTLPFTISDDELNSSSTDGKKCIGEEVQTQLLQVGMRVRRAVAEGYLGKHAVQKLSYSLESAYPATCPVTPSTPQIRNSGRELQPYADSESAMHKIGGFATQFNTYEDEDKPSYQDISWNYTLRNKRHFDDDSDSDESSTWHPQTPSRPQQPTTSFGMECFDHNPACDIEEPEFQLHEFTPPNQLARKFAKLRQRKNQIGVLGQVSNPSIFGSDLPSKQNLKRGSTLPLDFGDAGFLLKKEDVDMDWT